MSGQQQAWKYTEEPSPNRDDKVLASICKLRFNKTR